MFSKKHLLLPSLLCSQNQPASVIQETHFQIALPIPALTVQAMVVYNPNKNNNNEQHGEEYVVLHNLHLYWMVIAHQQ